MTAMTESADRARRRTIVCAACGETSAHRGHGYCFNCYARWVRHGRPVDGPPPPNPSWRKPSVKVKPLHGVDRETRFWVKVTKTEGCWLWNAAVHSSGYGVFSVADGKVLAHRFAYESCIGPIPDGLLIDHQCHNQDLECPGGFSCQHRRCVNPGHLEAVTQRENTLRGRNHVAEFARKTHCIRGHLFDEANTFVGADGSRTCRACVRLRRSAAER